MSNCLTGSQNLKPEEERASVEVTSEPPSQEELLPGGEWGRVGKELVGPVPTEPETYRPLSEQLSSSSTSTSAKSVSEVSSKEALQAMILSLPRYYCENPASCRRRRRLSPPTQ
ncbi:unnamed protein product [Ranitomeya imitator]|uniref:Uncharacterized protein n=1 Tax=Ranitomeya imitator TaxID=111125 RepID=A0ABN9M434_9NEOB|nr:unnamed protein product [Ranitomeya imitator]